MDFKPLIRPDKPPWPNTRHQHYIADIVARLCRWYGKDRRAWGGNLSRIFDAGVYDVFDPILLNSLLKAVRLLAVEDRPGALLELNHCKLSSPFATRSAALLLLRRLAQVIWEGMIGEDLSLLAQRISSIDTSQAQSKSLSGEDKYGTVSIFFMDRGYGFIHADDPAVDCIFNLKSWKSVTWPSKGERVKFKMSCRPNGKWRADWVHSLH